MDALDFNFLKQRARSTASGAVKTVRKGCFKPDMAARGAESPPLSLDESEKFMRIVAQISHLKRHFELFQLLQGKEIQHFIPHQVLISAWGNFSARNLNFDVTSAQPGVRTALVERYSAERLLTDLHKRWLSHGRQPLLLASEIDMRLAEHVHECTPQKSLQGVWSITVHGVINARDGIESLYIALNQDSAANGSGAGRPHPHADSLINQIDAAFHRIAALKSPAPYSRTVPRPDLQDLTAREEEIYEHMSSGKTNVDISNILGISVFTVKSHVQRILSKLDATNRTEAVAKYRQMGLRTPHRTMSAKSCFSG